MQPVIRHAVLILVIAACAAGCREPASETTYADAMHEEHKNDTPVASPMAQPSADTGDVDARMIEYGKAGGKSLRGYLAMPSDFDSTLPSVLVMHEWWGLNDNIRSMTEKLARAGYLALALDFYNGETAEDADAARALMEKATANAGVVKTNLRSAYNYLANVAGAEKIGTLGWCFGGGMSLQAALLMPQQIDATVIYYGRVETDSDTLAPLAMPILGIFGGADTGIPVDQVRKFETALKTLGKDADIRIYDGAGHAFANPSGTRYDASAAEDAWTRTLAFLDRHLK